MPGHDGKNLKTSLRIFAFTLGNPLAQNASLRPVVGFNSSATHFHDHHPSPHFWSKKARSRTSNLYLTRKFCPRYRSIAPLRKNEDRHVIRHLPLTVCAGSGERPGAVNGVAVGPTNTIVRGGPGTIPTKFRAGHQPQATSATPGLIVSGPASHYRCASCRCEDEGEWYNTKGQIIAFIVSAKPQRPLEMPPGLSPSLICI